jgi:hypothetical protein
MGLNQQLDLFKVELRASLFFSLAAMARCQRHSDRRERTPIHPVGVLTDG